MGDSPLSDLKKKVPEIEAKHVYKSFSDGPEVLKDISFEVAEGEFVCEVAGAAAGDASGWKKPNSFSLTCFATRAPACSRSAGSFGSTRQRAIYAFMFSVFS